MLFLLPLCLLASGASSLVIQFDGSLRLPRDPIRGFSSTGLDKVASCGSAILLDGVDDGGGDGDDRRRTTPVVAIGGRSIPLVPDMTSGDVEYDGLNLGLEWTVRAAEGGELDEVWWGTAASDNGDDDNNSVAKAAAPILVIRGDCKTVIDHLNGVAAPRKLRPKYEIAQGCIGRLQDYGRRRFGEGDGVIVKFEHVPRRENVLCDALCGRVIDAKLAETIGTALEAIRGGEASSTNPTTRLELPKSTKKRFKVTVTHFDRALGVISGSGRIPYSVRLGLYREVARAADRSDDGVALRRIGAVLVAESKRWPQTTNDDDNGSILTTGNDVKMLGILLDVAGLRRMDLNKEAHQAERKNRVVALNDDDEPDLVSAFIGDTNTLGARGKVHALLSPSWTGEDSEGGKWSDLLNSWYGVACELIQNRVEGSSIERGFWYCTSRLNKIVSE